MGGYGRISGKGTKGGKGGKSSGSRGREHDRGKSSFGRKGKGGKGRKVKRAEKSNPTTLADDSNIEAFVAAVFKELPNLTKEQIDKASPMYIDKLRINLYTTFGVLKKFMSTVGDWEDFCGKNGFADGFTKAARHHLGLQSSESRSSGEFIAEVKELTATAPSDRQRLRVGRVEFDHSIKEHVNRLSKAEYYGQYSRSLVLMSGSGVGKTFGPITARWGQQKLEKKPMLESDTAGQQLEEMDGLELVTAYIGFNCGFELTANEKIFDEGSVKLLVYKRLFAVLCALLNTAGDNLKNLDQEDSPIQKCLIDQVRWRKLPKFIFEADELYEPLLKKLTALGKLSESESRPVTLLVAVDEAQVLDEYVKGSEGKPMGARYALRCLRRLQQEVRRESINVLILPVAMGIDPAVSLPSETEGASIVLSKEGEVMLSRADFEELAKDTFERMGAPNRPYWDVYQAAMYPRARTLLNEDFTISPTSAACGFESKRHNATNILLAGVNGTELPIENIPLNLARVHDASGQNAIPIIDYGCVGTLVKKATHTEYKQLPWSEINLWRLNDKSYKFEESAFRVLALFISLFIYKETKLTANKPFKNWLGSIKHVNLKKVCDLPETESTFHPFQTARDLDKAIDKGLSPSVSELIESLEKEGDAVLMSCGGRAPVDFILIYHAGKNDDGSTLIEVRYADAKAGLSENLGDRIIPTYCQKVDKVHSGLTSNLAGYTVGELRKSDAVIIARRSSEDGRILNEDSWTWSPFTDILFALPNLGQEKSKKITKGKKGKKGKKGNSSNLCAPITSDAAAQKPAAKRAQDKEGSSSSLEFNAAMRKSKPKKNKKGEGDTSSKRSNLKRAAVPKPATKKAKSEEGELQ